MTPVLGPWHISIHSESPVDPPDLSPTDRLRHERLHAVPQSVVERWVDDPVEIVRKDTRIFALRPHGRIGDELHGLACADDGRAFLWCENVPDEAEIGHYWVVIDFCLWTGAKKNCIVLRGEENCRVEVRWLAEGTRSGLDDTELLLLDGCGGENRLVSDGPSQLACGLCRRSKIPSLLKRYRA